MSVLALKELKERYYKVCKKLFESRVARGLDVEENQKKLDAGGLDFDRSGFGNDACSKGNKVIPLLHQPWN